MVNHRRCYMGFVLASLLVLSPQESTAQDRGLVSSVTWGETEAVRELLEAGDDPNEPRNGVLPLNAAVQRNDLRLVQLLLEHGADPNRQADFGGYGPALSDATRLGSSLSIVRALLEAGANPDGIEDRPGSPLFYAASHGSRPLVQVLLEAGAEPGHRDDVQVAASGGHVEIVRDLLEAGTYPQPDEMLRAAQYFRYVRDGNAEEVRRMIEDGVEANLSVYEVKAGERWAEEQGLNPSDIGGWTALMAAAESGQREVARFLIERGADVNALAYHLEVHVGVTPVFVATMGHHADIVELLLESGADPNVGASPLAYAVLSGHASIVSLLLDAGADPEGVAFFSTAREAAEESGNDLTLHLLNGEAAQPDVRRAFVLTDEAWHIALETSEWLRNSEQQALKWHDDYRDDAEAGLQEMSRTIGGLFEDRFEVVAEPLLSDDGLQFLELSSEAGTYTVLVTDQWVVEGSDPESGSRVTVEIEDVYNPHNIKATTTLAGDGR